MPGAGGQQPQQRTTFRPPWVKDGPPALPMPSAPWALNNRRDSKPTTEDAPAFTKVTLKVKPTILSTIQISRKFTIENLEADQNQSENRMFQTLVCSCFQG